MTGCGEGWRVGGGLRLLPSVPESSRMMSPERWGGGMTSVFGACAGKEHFNDLFDVLHAGGVERCGEGGM